MKKITLALGVAALAAQGIALAEDTGESLYANHCASCHGKNREGATGPNLVDATWSHGEPTKANLTSIISKGVLDKGMPAWGAVLSAAQIDLLTEFLQTKPTAAVATTAAADELAQIRVPKGFTLSIYADNLPTARAMAVDDKDVVYVGSRKAGKVYALVDSNKDGVADKTYIIAEGLDNPQGVTLLNGALYVSEITRVIRFDNIAKTFDKKPRYKIVKDDFPKDTWHGEKVIKASPDGRLYVPIGAPCNVCDKENGPYEKIYSMKPDGSDFQVFARGIRNSVGFAFHPVTKELWFTDNNRDMMGDNMPSCELNHAPKAGMHFGFPYCHSGVLLDPEFGVGKNCDDYTPPVVQVGPHTAPLGLAFYTGNMFPSDYKNQLFIAEHGSWNRSQKIGYRVSLVTLVNNKLLSHVPFVEFLNMDKVMGRPVDVAQLSDGSLLISDDDRGRVYRVTYRAPPVEPKQ